MKLVTIKTSQSITDLGLIQSYLESEGIESFIKDEYTRISTYNIEPVKLQVREKDAEKSIALLIKGGFATPEDYEAGTYESGLQKFIYKIISFFTGNR